MGEVLIGHAGGDVQAHGALARCRGRGSLACCRVRRRCKWGGDMLAAGDQARHGHWRARCWCCRRHELVQVLWREEGGRMGHAGA